MNYIDLSELLLFLFKKKNIPNLGISNNVITLKSVELSPIKVPLYMYVHLIKLLLNSRKVFKFTQTSLQWNSKLTQNFNLKLIFNERVNFYVVC